MQDAGVTARTGLEPRAQVVEELLHHHHVAQAGERQPPTGFGVRLAERDQRLDHTAQFLGLGQGGTDGFVMQQRDAQIPQQRAAVRSVTRQLSPDESMTHIEPR